MTQTPAFKKFIEEIKALPLQQSDSSGNTDYMVPMFSLAHALNPDTPQDSKAYADAMLELRNIKRQNRKKGDKKIERYKPLKEWVFKRSYELRDLRPKYNKDKIAQKIWEELDEDRHLLNGCALPAKDTIKRHWMPKGQTKDW